ncbi:unnamed protein product [Alopecurus aequalis]
MSTAATSPLSSLEAMLHSLMGRSGEGGGETRIDEEGEREEEEEVESPPPPRLPVRPTARGRLPSQPRVAGAAVGSWTPPSTPSPHEGDEAVTADISVAVAELERKAAEAEARLRQKEEENAALRRRIESYHVRWLEYEIRIKSLEEAFHDQLASLQMTRDAARMAQELPYPYDDRHGSSVTKVPCEDAPPGRLWQAGCRRSADGSKRSSAVGRLGAEFCRGSQALERGAAALAAEPRPPWQPGVPSADSVGDLKKLKAQFRAWKKDYKARLRKAKAEMDRDRRRQSSCWI